MNNFYYCCNALMSPEWMTKQCKSGQVALHITIVTSTVNTKI